jgi:hypothetical protein
MIYAVHVRNPTNASEELKGPLYHRDPPTPDERQEISVDGRGLRGRHAVRKTLVGLQGTVPKQLCAQRT